MQKTIESFFKHSSTPPSALGTSNSDDLFDGIRAQKRPEVRVKYTYQSTRYFNFSPKLFFLPKLFILNYFIEYLILILGKKNRQRMI